MRLIVLDNDTDVLMRLGSLMEEMQDIEMIEFFTDPVAALDYIRTNPVDAVVLNIRVFKPEDRVFLNILKKEKQGIVIVFSSEYEEDAIRSWKERADLFIKKPFVKDDVQNLAEVIRLLMRRQKKRITARTFGRFDLFIDDKLVFFTNSKAKELLALCVDRRGGMVTMEEAVDKLWEDRSYDSRVKNLYRKAVMYLKHYFHEKGLDNFFLTIRGACSIDAGSVDCDLYDLLEGKKEAEQKWWISESYMEEYSWAEEMTANIERYIENCFQE